MKILTLNTNEINQNGYHINKLTCNKIGFIYIAPANLIPDDCLACDGYALKIDDYQKLYSIIGKDYNDGSELEDEFRVPDYNLTGLFLQPGSKNFGTKKSAGLPNIDLALRIDAGATVKQYYSKSSNYRVPKELFLKFQKELAQYRSESQKPKAIRCVETGQVFKCARDTHRWLHEKGITASYSVDSAIKFACKNPKRKAYGFHWEFVEKY